MIKKMIAASGMGLLLFGATAPAEALTIRYRAGSFYSPTNVAPGVSLVESFDGFATGRVTGGFIRGSSTLNVADPQSVNSADRYLEVRSNLVPAQAFVVALPGEQKVFAFDVRDVRSTSELRVTFADNSTQTYTGSQILGLASLQDAAGPAGRVRFNYGPFGIGAISLAFFSPDDAQGNRWAVDNVASAVPEPATWGMLMIGFGVAGAALRRRRTAVA